MCITFTCKVHFQLANLKNKKLFCSVHAVYNLLLTQVQIEWIFCEIWMWISRYNFRKGCGPLLLKPKAHLVKIPTSSLVRTWLERRTTFEHVCLPIVDKHPGSFSTAYWTNEALNPGSILSSWCIDSFEVTSDARKYPLSFIWSLHSDPCLALGSVLLLIPDLWSSC